jgi:monofunctional biosynthetic peptidoglycan transglycosylase
MKNLFRIVAKTLLYFFCITIIWVIILKWISPPFTPLMGIRWSQLFFSSTKSAKIYYNWVPITQMAKAMPKAVIASEDQSFLDHSGFDFEAIWGAIAYNKTHKRKIGGSTISQQVAKNVFLWPGRDYLRKGLEVYFTFLIEFIWGKKRIMEVYLNIVELNENRFGVESGAKYAFNLKANNLSQTQCARLAAILPSPKRFSALRPSGYVLKRQSQINYQINCMALQLQHWYTK